jgi:hypothetical protein
MWHPGGLDGRDRRREQPPEPVRTDTPCCSGPSLSVLESSACRLALPCRVGSPTCGCSGLDMKASMGGLPEVTLGGGRAASSRRLSTLPCACVRRRRGAPRGPSAGRSPTTGRSARLLSLAKGGFWSARGADFRRSDGELSAGLVNSGRAGDHRRWPREVPPPAPRLGPTYRWNEGWAAVCRTAGQARGQAPCPRFARPASIGCPTSGPWLVVAIADPRLLRNRLEGGLFAALGPLVGVRVARRRRHPGPSFLEAVFDHRARSGRGSPAHPVGIQGAGGRRAEPDLVDRARTTPQAVVADRAQHGTRAAAHAEVVQRTVSHRAAARP